MLFNDKLFIEKNSKDYIKSIMVLCWGSVSEKTIRTSAQSLMNSKFKTKQNNLYIIFPCNFKNSDAYAFVSLAFPKIMLLRKIIFK